VCTPSDDPEAEEGGPPCRASRPQRPTSGPSAPTRGRPLTLPEAAAYLNVAERYMRRLVTDRRIPYFKVGRLLRFSAEDLDAFLERGRIEPSAIHPLLVPRRGR
jgi:excisionase family DNA binding protein